MFGKLVLIGLQIAGGWAGTPLVERYISMGGNAQTFIRGVIAAVVVWVIGLIGAQVLKDVSQPSPATLTWSVAGGLIGAAIIVFKLAQLAQISLPAPPLAIILGFAMIGYHLKK